jgi:TPR repeat protein
MRWLCIVGLLLCAVSATWADEAQEKQFAATKAEAEKGDVEAQNKLGYFYNTGTGVKKDDAEAVKWYRKAAEQGHTNAQFSLGVMYQEGEGVEKDPSEALKWYRSAAEQGFGKAQCNLGGMYEEGKGVEQDYAEAVKWYRKAAEQEDASAQHNLGFMYANGTGVEKDLAEALKWCRKAAEQGHAESQYSLGVMYANGTGVEKNLAKALKWHRKAAEQGHAWAQALLGGMYGAGLGVERDYSESYAWINLAAKTRPEAAEARDSLEKTMSAEQIAEGQRRTKELRSRIEARAQGSAGEKGVGEALAEQPTATGTGFLITRDGYLVTNEHVTGDATRFRVVTAQGVKSAKLVKVDKGNDLAVLKIEGTWKALAVAPSRSVKLGQTVGTVGFPNVGLQGFAPKTARGEIASLSGAMDSPQSFQISVPIQPGNSGGPLFDLRGNVVGVVVAKLSARAALASSGSLPENVNYAVKSGYLLSFLESMPQVADGLLPPTAKEGSFEDAVKMAEDATVLLLAY